MRIPVQSLAAIGRLKGVAAASGFALACSLVGATSPEGSCSVPTPAGAECRIVDVPEQHGQPGRTIGILVMQIPSRATTPSPDPAVVLVGGPGQAAAPLANMLVGRFAGVLATRDLILVDQRGTGGSNRLACASNAPNDPSRLLGPPYTEAELAQCAATLSRRADLGAYTTTNSAHDLDLIRQALGVQSWTLMGGSYGTRLALEYARLYPAATRALVLEGVAGPEFANPLPHARGGQAALDSLFAACANDTACAGAYPDLPARLAQVLARLDSGKVNVAVPGRTGPPVSLGREEFVYGLHLLLFSNESSPAIPFLVSRAHARDYWPMANVIAQVTAGLVGQIDLGMQLSVTCAEDAPRFTREDIARETAGTYLRDVLAGSSKDECEKWPVDALPALPVVPLDVPALLLSGAWDPATPPSFAQRVADRMQRATSILVPYGAHVTSDPCIESIIAEYVGTLAVSDARRSCLANGRRPPFLLPPT